ncbi:MAG: nucleotidyltransferase domain-containing protein [Hydrogenothermaceae bacterium]|nr:nucleotidyltransferase domain-containing protein [Hydrogenothermaceae bacterium]
MSKVRLSKEDIAIIKTTAKEIFGEDIKIYIFGSRANLNKKGGDIDIYIESPKEVSLQEKVKFLAKLELRGIERKVDLVIKTPQSPKKSIFQEAKQKGVEI